MYCCTRAAEGDHNSIGVWQHRDETNNFHQKHDNEIIKEQKRLHTQVSYHTHFFIHSTNNNIISQISNMAKIHNFIFTKLTRLLLEVPTRH